MIQFIDAFPFYNELDVLEIRLKNLDPYVDRFILVESPETHTGVPKPLYFEENKHRFEKWLPKITHIVAPVCPSTGLWDREKFQRDSIRKGLENISDDTLVMISDADEIPDFDVLKDYVFGPVTSLHMLMFEYSFEYMFTGEKWIGTVVTNAALVREHGPNYFRDYRWNFPQIQNAGWHLSSFGNVDHVWNKIITYAHANDEKHRRQTRDEFERFLDEGIHSDGRIKLLPRPPWVKLPKI